MKEIKKKTGAYLLDAAFFVSGSFFYAIAVDSFTAPNEIVIGGVTGVAILLNHLLRIPIGFLIIVINIPLFVLGAKIIGLKFIAKTVVATVISSLFIDLLAPYLPTFMGDDLLSSLYGGIFTGVGIALVLLREATTGGVDIVARLINKKKPHFSIGRIILLIDFFVVTLSGIIYKNMTVMLYSLITIYVGSKVLDSVLYGIDKGKFVMIVSGKIAEISKVINSELNRGATVIKAKGAYTGQERDILLCAVRKSEVTKIHRLVKKIDDAAFLVITEADDIIGEGFNALK